jgi:hypothetical protein
MDFVIDRWIRTTQPPTEELTIEQVSHSSWISFRRRILDIFSWINWNFVEIQTIADYAQYALKL